MNPRPLLLLLIFPQFAGISVARSAGLEPATFSVRSQARSRTGGDREGQGETKPRFYQQLSILRGTGRDMGLWYRCGTKGSLTYGKSSLQISPMGTFGNKALRESRPQEICKESAMSAPAR